MPASTKIRWAYHFLKNIECTDLNLQGFIVKLLKKTTTEGCNEVLVFHGDKFDTDYNVSIHKLWYLMKRKTYLDNRADGYEAGRIGL